MILPQQSAQAMHCPRCEVGWSSSIGWRCEHCGQMGRLGRLPMPGQKVVYGVRQPGNYPESEARDLAAADAERAAR